jgi:nucleoside-diphosphate-sugar epimerase
MEASTLAKLSQEQCAVSNRVGKVRHRRSASEQGTDQHDATTAAEPDEAGFPGQDGHGRIVAVTGAARGLGRQLTQQLAGSAEVARVVAIDDHRGDVAGVTWRVVDVRDPALAGRLAGVDVLVHTDLDLAPESDPRTRRAFNVRGAQTVLTAAAAGGVGRVVLVTSAMVYGAKPDNPVPLPESAPLGLDTDGSVVGDLMEIEHLAERSPRTHPGMEVTVARPAALVGQGVDTLITRHFESPRLLAVKGGAARWQFCHINDLVTALELAVAGKVSGSFAVGCDGWLDTDQLEELSGLRRIELPASITFATAQRLHRAGITPALVTDLHFMVYPWVVDCQALRAAGWRPSYDNAAALEVLMTQRAGHHAVAGRRLGRKDATITAAGATVAVIGTAAIVRQARKRRHGD